MARRDRRAAGVRARKALKNGNWGEWDKVPPSQWPPGAPPGQVAAWRNLAYVVLLREIECDWGLVQNLMIRPSTEKAGVDWATMQRIKRELVGDVTAVEIYPTEANLVDQANMYHLWILPDGMELPFSL